MKFAMKVMMILMALIMTINAETAKAKNPVVVLETSEGTIELELYPNVAPKHVANFLELANKGFYNGVIFHRVIDGFMIQGGDPTGTGMGDSGKRIPAEFNDSLHHAGTLSMARSNDPNSASCQFFICLGPQSFLDHKYTVFGNTIKGYDVVQKIGKTPTSSTILKTMGPAAGKAELLKQKDAGADVKMDAQGNAAPDRPLKTVKIIKAYEKK
jgi:cyclophilin family peptidyl-prolyl cis-trans isomerase